MWLVATKIKLTTIAEETEAIIPKTKLLGYTFASSSVLGAESPMSTTPQKAPTIEIPS
jgi:hypothetical protein